MFRRRFGVFGRCFVNWVVDSVVAMSFLFQGDIKNHRMLNRDNRVGFFDERFASNDDLYYTTGRFVLNEEAHMSAPIHPPRRSTAFTHAAYTRCAGTWLEHEPTKAELVALRDAMEVARSSRNTVAEKVPDLDAYHRLSLDLFRHDRFRPLALDGWLIATVIDALGEPPIVEDENDPAFTQYIRQALGEIASARIRRAIAEQAQRFLPVLINENDIEGAVLLAQNTYMTMMSESTTPLLVQVMVSGLSAYYDELPEE